MQYPDHGLSVPLYQGYTVMEKTTRNQNNPLYLCGSSVRSLLFFSTERRSS